MSSRSWPASDRTPLRNGAKCSPCVSFGNRVGRRGGGEIQYTGKASQQHPFERGRCAAAGRKREINIARRSGELGSGVRRGTAGRGPHRGLELELDGSPARKIHIFKYFSHGPQSPRHAALPPTACYPLRTYYLPGTCLGIAAGTPRVSGFLVTRCRFLSVPFPLSLPLSFVTIRRTMARITRVFSARRRVRARFSCIAVSRGSTSTGELLPVETLRPRREM